MQLKILVAIDSDGSWSAIGGADVEGVKTFGEWNLTDGMGLCNFYALEVEADVEGPKPEQIEAFIKACKLTGAECGTDAET